MNSNRKRSSIHKIASLVTAGLVAVFLSPNQVFAGESSELSWQQSPTSLALVHGEQILWRLVADPKDPKPYIHPLRTMKGKELTAFRPKDHPWHHGLWWSWKFINGVNYWEENPKTHKSAGCTELLSAKFQTAGDFSATADLSLSYHLPDGPSLMTEQRQLKISAPDQEDAYWIDWTSVFNAGEKGVLLGRTPLPGEAGGKSYGGYAGLSARLVLDPEGWDIRSNHGRISAKGFHGKTACWVDFSSKGAGITIFDHPKNLRTPSPWYIHDRKPMSFFSPSILYKQSLTLAAGESLTLRYRILVHTRPMTHGQLEAKSREFHRITQP
ncbi:MAG: PmoA family protein [Verrucomicrobiae bacterium]|nr:PmoA family protein [Verrucomicrobiae bacterium]NNJ87319.1 PmoA family protein [Akkermansiaceae bacterium]